MKVNFALFFIGLLGAVSLVTATNICEDAVFTCCLNWFYDPTAIVFENFNECYTALTAGMKVSALNPCPLSLPDPLETCDCYKKQCPKST